MNSGKVKWPCNTSVLKYLFLASSIDSSCQPNTRNSLKGISLRIPWGEDEDCELYGKYEEKKEEQQERKCVLV